MPTMASSDAPSVKVILSSSTDWEPWYTVLKDQASSLNVWDYVDPDKTTPNPPQPRMPTYADFKPDATELRHLVDGGNTKLFELYKFAITDWQFKTRIYDRQVTVLQDVATYIRTTVATNWMMLVKDKVTVQEKVKALKSQLAPTDYTSKMIARERYQKAQKGSGYRIGTAH